MALFRYRIQGEGFDYWKEVQFYVESFQHYSVEINKFIDVEIATARERYNAFLLELQNDPTWEHEWFDYELELNTKEGLADIYMDSLIISMYSFVECKMLFLCEYFEKGQVFKVRDIAGKSITGYRKYLEKAAGMDFALVQAEWADLLKYNELRNIPLHHIGTRTLPGKNRQLIEFLNSTPGVEVVRDGDMARFRFRSNEFVFAFFRTCHFILDYLFHEKVKM